MSKKSIIALITATVLLFTAGVSVGVFLYTRGTTQATEGTRTTSQNQVADGTQSTDQNQVANVTQPTDQNQVADGGNQVTDGTQTDDNNENPTITEYGDANSAENNNTTVDNVGETTIERVEEQEKLVSRAYWDWWKPMEVALARSNVNVNEPKISVKKSAITGVGGDKFVFAGQDIIYVIAVTNNSDTEVEDIEITDKVPQNTTFVSIEDAMIDDNVVGTKTTVGTENAVVGVKWVVTIPAGETAIARFTVNVNETMLDENEREVETTGIISNVAIANGEESKDPTNNPDEGNETKTSIITANKSSVVTRNGEEVEVAKFNDLITYTITVENTGDVEGTTYIADTVPEGTEFVSAQEGAKVSEVKDSLVWSITLGAKETVTRTFTVKVIEVDEAIENIANVGGTDTNIEITETAGIDVIKSATGVTRTTLDKEGNEVVQNLSETTPVRPEDVVTYTITVTNTGTTTLKNVVVTDDLLPNFEETIASLEPKATKTYTVNYKVTQKDVDTQTVITNVATATAEDGTTDTDAENTVPTDKTADFTIDKRASLTKKEGNESEKAEVGDTITYTIIVKNVGSITLEGIEIVDTMLGINENATLATGETKIITEDHLVSVDEIATATNNDGKLSNLAIATYGETTKDSSTSTDVRTEYNYTVEYYYDGEIDNNKTDKFTAIYDSSISEYTDKNITGYKLEKVETAEIDKELPLVITENADNNVIRVYYVKDSFKYTVEYYYDGIKDASKTDELTAVYGSSINEYVDKKTEGYELEKTENLPLTITTVVANNIIKVYYEKPDISITKNTQQTTANVGEEITYTLTLKNNGKVAGTTTVTDTLPEGLTYVSSDNNGSHKDGVITWINVTVPENGIKVITVKAKVNADKIGATVTNTATVSDDTPSTTPEQKNDTVTTVVNELKATQISTIQGEQGKDSVNAVLVMDLSSSMNKTVYKFVECTHDHAFRTKWNGKKEEYCPEGCKKQDDGTWGQNISAGTRLSIAKKSAQDFINKIYTNLDSKVTVTVVTFNQEEPGSSKYVGTKVLTFGTNNTKTTATNKDYKELVTEIGKIDIGTETTGYGTHIKAALDTVYTTIYGENGLTTKYPNNGNTVIFLGDGDPTPTSYDEFKDNTKDNIYKSATNIKNAGATINSIGFGSDAINPDSDAYEVLQKISSNNKVYTAEDSESLAKVFTNLQEELQFEKPVTTNNGIISIVVEKNLVVDENNAITVEYDGKQLFSCTSMDSLSNYNLAYNSATKTLTFGVNAYNANQNNITKITENNKLIIRYFIER